MRGRRRGSCEWQDIKDAVIDKLDRALRLNDMRRRITSSSTDHDLSAATLQTAFEPSICPQSSERSAMFLRSSFRSIGCIQVSSQNALVYTTEKAPAGRAISLYTKSAARCAALRDIKIFPCSRQWTHYKNASNRASSFRAVMNENLSPSLQFARIVLTMSVDARQYSSCVSSMS